MKSRSRHWGFGTPNTTRTTVKLLTRIERNVDFDELEQLRDKVGDDNIPYVCVAPSVKGLRFIYEPRVLQFSRGDSKLSNNRLH